jgi:hypothetical protein
MSITHWRKPPRRLMQAKLDNLVLVPGSQLPFKAKWLELANALPHGSTLVVVPSRACPERTVLQVVVSSLQAKGLPVACHSV